MLCFMLAASRGLSAHHFFFFALKMAVLSMSGGAEAGGRNSETVRASYTQPSGLMEKVEPFLLPPFILRVMD